MKLGRSEGAGDGIALRGPLGLFEGSADALGILLGFSEGPVDPDGGVDGTGEGCIEGIGGGKMEGLSGISCCLATPPRPCEYT